MGVAIALLWIGGGVAVQAYHLRRNGQRWVLSAIASAAATASGAVACIGGL